VPHRKIRRQVIAFHFGAQKMFTIRSSGMELIAPAVTGGEQAYRLRKHLQVPRVRD
jgi:hypothetical protein